MQQVIEETSLLDYERQIFLDAFHEDGLLIMARGMGIQRIFLNFLNLYNDPGNLVLVLNTNNQEEDFFLDHFRLPGTKPLVKSVTSEYSASDRQKLYLEGGVLFITSRILVVDLLTDRVPIDHVTGILVYKAHRIVESCQEAFILRLYRQKNKKGFVKAFSDNPEAFTSGFCHVEHVMKSLFVRRLFLWPRFHANVVDCYEKHKVDVVELHLQLSPSMTACQTSLLDLIDACVKELKICNPKLDTDEMTVENAIHRRFKNIIHLYLDPVWHQLGSKTQQLVADIKTLGLLLSYLTQYDCVSFYNFVNSLRTSEKTFGTNSGWLFLEAADRLFSHARSRVFGHTDKTKVKTKSEKKKDEGLLLEECPKWKMLHEVLTEIQAETNKKHKDQDVSEPARVLIAAADDRTCNQIKEYLCDGGNEMLKRLYMKTCALKLAASSTSEQTGNKFRKIENKGKGKNKLEKGPSDLTLTQLMDPKESNDGTEESSNNPASLLSDKCTDAMSTTLDGLVTILHPLKGASDQHSLIRTLQELEPSYVVLYDADMVLVRELEVFRAARPDKSLRVYFLMYTGSTEEQKYLTTLRREKEAFEYLIKEKATMVVPEERDGKLEDDPSLSRDTTPANRTVNTRHGGDKQHIKQTIIVDMREFRSELPSLIHRRGIEIEPVTIEVGDYILSPDICVERKSISDLIGSLNNGRLYNQCVSMCRYYKRPVLLIEFDPKKPFTLQGKHSLSSELSSNDVTSRLALLTMHFPQVRILWCQSPYATAEVFEELKVGREQPTTTAAMAAGEHSESDLTSGKYNHSPQEMLLKMPGVNTKNVHRLLNHVENIAHLVKLSQPELVEILGSEVNAKPLYDFIHVTHKRTENAVSSKTNTSNVRRFPLNTARRKRKL